MKHFQVHFQPDDLRVRIHGGATLFEAAGLAGIIINTPCGGVGRCGKCKVILLPAEKEVLACQYIIEHDLQVRVPNESRFFKQKILEHGIDRRMKSHPAVQKIFIPTESCTGMDEFCQTLSARLDTQLVIRDEMNDELMSLLGTGIQAGLTTVLKPDTEGIGPPEASACQLVSIEQGDTTENHYGLAVDIGTTTIVGQLINLHNPESSVTVSASNPQTQFGADVVSRISYSQEPAGYEKLHDCLIDCLNDLATQAATQAKIKLTDIYEIVAAGNTTMNHLLLKYPLVQLGQAPYHAHSLLATNQQPAQTKLKMNPAGNIHTIANIAGFVGSDTVAAALACGLDIAESMTLLVDIGTNGEIVLGTKDRLLAASCAAGPALEGAGIECGSRAQSGAIERVILTDDDIDIDIIDDGQANTICGSGLIDAVAVLLELDIIEPTGRFCDPVELDPFMPKKLTRRLIQYKDAPAFVLAGTYDNHQWTDAVVLTQKDVRQFQLAKAAICAGIRLLLKQADCPQNSIQQLLLAGAFGNYIQKENAVRVGLLPDIGLEKIHFVGNAAGSGAQLVLTSQKARRLANDLAGRIEYLEIAHQTEFQMIFSECLLFPEKQA